MAQLKRSTSFSSFLNLSSLFEKKDTKTLELQQKADHFLESGRLDIYHKMIANGYQATPKQESLFNNTLHHIVNQKEHNNQKNEILANLIVAGYTLSPQQYVNVITHPVVFGQVAHVFSKEDNHLKHLYQNTLYQNTRVDLIMHLRSLRDIPEYRKALFTHWQDEFLSLPRLCFRAFTEDRKITYADVDRRVTDIFSHGYEYLFKDVSLSEYLEFTKKIDKRLIKSPVKDYILNNSLDDGDQYFKKLYTTVQLHLSQNLERLFPTDLQHIIQETQIHYLNEHLSQLAQSATIDVAKNFTINTLPEVAQNTIADIKNCYSKLAGTELSVENKHNVEHLVQEQLPQILKKYFNMDSEYRTTMKDSQGKNADDLLNEALCHLHTHLQDIVVSSQENNLTQLKVEVRYMQAKNKM